MTQRRAFVTGAGGFIGKHLLRELVATGWIVTGLVRRPDQIASIELLGAQALVGDLHDPGLQLANITPDTVVFHLAASMTTWASGVEQGVSATEKLVRLMVRNRCERLISVSSAAVHWRGHGRRIVDERLPLGPHPPWNHFVKQKLLTESLVMSAQAEGRLVVTVVRPSKVLGPGDRSLVPWVAKRLTWVAGMVADDRNCRRPVVVVGELARGLAACAEAKETAGRAYYLSSTTEVTKGQLLDAFIAAGMPVPRRPLAKSLGFAVGRLGVSALDSSWRVVRPRSSGPRAVVVAALERRAGFPVDHDCVISSSRAAADFGWRGSDDVEPAIHQAVQWHRQEKADQPAELLT